MKPILNIQEISQDEIRQMNREYNPRVWDETIDRYAKYKGVRFFVAPKQNGYEYERYYAVYTIPEGIMLLKSVGYSSCLSNAGFSVVLILDGKLYQNQELRGIENSKENRKKMAEHYKGVLFTTEF